MRRLQAKTVCYSEEGFYLITLYTMNKQELEKMFDEMFQDEVVEERYDEVNKLFIKTTTAKYNGVKDFIFEKVIPEVLRNVCDYEWKEKSKAEWIKYATIEQKAKELYDIEL